MLDTACIPVEVHGFAIVEHVVFFVEVVPRLLRKLLIEGEHEVVLCEAAFALGNCTADVQLALLRLVEADHALVALSHFLLIQIGVRLF